MADDNDKSDETPEEVTMKDLWRHISGLKGEIQGVRSELKEEIQGVETRLNDKIEGVETRLSAKMDAGFADLNGQAQAIREVVDREHAILWGVYATAGSPEGF